MTDIPQSTVDAVLEFLNASDKRSAMERHWQELNSGAADAAIARILKSYSDDAESLSHLRSMRHLLYRCRNEGVSRSFDTPSINFAEDVQDAVHKFVNANGTDETREVYERLSGLLRLTDADRVLDFMLLFYQDDPQLCGRLEERKHQLQQCHEGRIDEAFPPDQFEVPQHIAEAVGEFIDAPDWPSKKRVLRARKQELLSEEAVAFLDFITSDKDASKDPMIAKLVEHRSILERCRLEGLDVVVGKMPDSELPIATPMERELEELTKALNQLMGSTKVLMEKDVELLLERRPDLRRAWEFRRDHLMALPDEDSGRQQLVAILEELTGAFELRDFRKQIYLLRKALSLPLTEQLHELWGALHYQLGTALSQCSGKDRDELVEESLKHHRIALTVFEADSMPKERAENLRHMGNAYCQRPGGDHAQNLEEAIRCYEESIELHTRVEGPAPPDLYQNLGNVYVGRVKGNRRDNAELAIKYLTLALDDLDPKTSPLECADVKLNLGNAFLRRVQGDKADNIERALSLYDFAYRVYASSAAPSDRLGMCHLGMMDAYMHRILGEAKSNREIAISEAQKAIRALPRDMWPEKWAEAQNRLGYLHYEHAKSENDMNQAIECFERALEVYDRASYPADWAKIQVNLGAAWSRNSRRQPCADKAIECYSNALELYTRHRFPERWSSIHHNLGQLYGGMDVLGEDVANQAEEHFTLALEARSADPVSQSAFDSHEGLARVRFRRDAWEPAHASLSAALESAEKMFSSSYTEEGRRHELGNVSGLYAMDAFCLLRLGRTGEALRRLEQGKTRLLSEAMALSDVDATMLSENDEIALRLSRAAVQKAETSLATVPPNVNIRDTKEGETLRTARQNLSEVISSIRERTPEFLPSGISTSELAALVPIGGAVVVLFITDHGSGAFVVPHGAEITNDLVIESQDLNTSTLRRLLFGPDTNGDSRCWFSGYAHLNFGGNFSSWQAVLSDVTSVLWERLMGQVADRLTNLGIRKGAPVVLIPQGGLGILPLHAAWRQEGSDRHYFSDDYVVSYVPSGFAWGVSQRRITTRDYDSEFSLLAVINPTLDLPFASEEGDEVSTQFQWKRCVRLDGEFATPEETLKASTGMSHVHFACHGSYDWSAPLASRLELANEKPLHLTDIIKGMDLHSCRLVVLSACETGLTEFQRTPDEFLGLPSGFLQAGAPAVISSLWPVSDFSTMLLMKHFYEKHLGEKLAPAQALHSAQSWLRNARNKDLAELFHDLRDSAPDRPRMSFRVARERFLLDPAQDECPFAHPHYWAAFTVTGV